ncbi:MAG: ABC transporter permease subunit [Acidobacteriaceae bacterium]|nr:ABC transporter permease subunit [Acidobacteriaceae bacterium]
MIASTTLARTGIALFALLLLYPFLGFLAPIGQWHWGESSWAQSAASIRVSLVLTGIAMLIVVATGTPVALYVARCPPPERLWWQALLLLSILLPPLALGILLSIAFNQAGFRFSNTPAAFVATQVYVSIGYYVLGAVAAFDAVPPMMEKHAALLGRNAWQVFWRISFPLSRLGLAVALSVAWVRAIGEFGAVAVTAYYPSGMPVQLWINLESFGLPAVMPLLAVFLAAALPFPWIVHLLAQRRPHA